MATIYYFGDTGAIYGVHPSGQPVTGGVPAGVLSIEVPEPPDQIPWPSPGNGLVGREAWCQVNTVTRVVEAKPGIATQEATRRQQDFDAAKLVKAAVLALLDEIDARHPAKLVDRAAFRQAMFDRYRVL